jgi:hypothetical protein
MAKKRAKQSKAKRPSRAVKSRSQLDSVVGIEEYRQRLAALDGIVLTDMSGVSWQTFNDTLRSAIDTDAAHYAAVVDTDLRMRGWPDGSEDIEFVCQHIRTALELGFRMAVARYREHLEHVPELHRRRDTDASRSRKANDARRVLLNLDDRNAAIVAEFAALRATMKAGDAQYALAKKYGVTDKQIRNVLTEARNRK